MFASGTFNFLGAFTYKFGAVLSKVAYEMKAEKKKNENVRNNCVVLYNIIVVYNIA